MNALRQRQMRNMHMALLLSQGTPMVLMGEPSARCPALRHPLHSTCWLFVGKHLACSSEIDSPSSAACVHATQHQDAINAVHMIHRLHVCSVWGAARAEIGWEAISNEYVCAGCR